ncbi:TPA: isoleucine--tRNA ligase [Candidatus Saccharibacteria bacterium]|nr:isoleucine--tRNA ligase [Candidatus Saccharibacteria bacterium]HRJ90802.1 isoleucine--tRNA ligase [Candidatus Saccharibacteria bacterium]
MKFKHGTRRRAIEYEKDWVRRWKANKTFEQSVENRSKNNSYVFYDGPPFISGVPHHGTLLSSIVKDAVPRYQTMKGKRVERVWGWDCHGLPAERFTEKKLGIHSRQEVIEYGIEKYINATRENMVQTSSEWEDVVDRIGRWVDFKGAYKTMDKDYMESIWWAFKTLYEKGKIYEGEKVLMYCTLDGTPLSKAEVTMDAGAYQDVTDPSVFVKFKLDDGGTLLAWTTTPWTLPANTALAVNEKLTYVEVEVGGETFILAKELLEKVLQDEKHQPLEYKTLRELKGSELVGKSYEPLLGVNRGEGAHKVWHAPYVSHEDGTGIVHIAPAYGEEDFELAKEVGIPVIHTIDENGFFTEGDWQGKNVWEINKQIAKDLHERGVVWKIDYIRHSYPHCHRCGTKLMYRAHPSWFMDINGQRELMIEKNEPINWFPEHVKNGRFEKTVEQAPDWNISRDRFWATAMPVWKTKSGKVRVVGSYSELKELSGAELEDYHRPWVDDVKFSIDGEEYTRIDKVMDSWFEAGSMPFAQFHYPFENKEKFEANFPGDFIVEYIGQVRAWFYYMHAMSVALFGENSFNNVIVTGNVAGNDGRKMSKSYGNYTDPNELMDKFSADSLRFLLLSSPLLNGEDFALQDKEVGDVARKLSMVWNMYDFFTMYAEVDGWEYDASKALSLQPDELKNPLDVWVVSRVHELNQHVSKHMDAYDIPEAMSDILPFIEDASNWFVRRSRRRFWKSEETSDKADAYRTLHYVLMKLSMILAPFTPFLAEELHHNLGGENSVHLLDWPTDFSMNEQVLAEMREVREYVNEGLSLRAKAGLKVRQPLVSVTVPKLGSVVDYESILTEELNVKEVKIGSEVSIDETITPELKREGMMREIIRHVQAARKNAGLNVDDRILLRLTTQDSELQTAIAEHSETIQAEVLAAALDDVSHAYTTEARVDEVDLTVSLEKA